MGHIQLVYNVDKVLLKRGDINIRTLVDEIEYGASFAIFPEREIITPIKSKKLKWIKWKIENDLLFLYIEDDFFHNDTFFEQILTSFVINLIDFATIKLVDIDITNSIMFSSIKLSEGCIKSVFDSKSKPIIGTIFKPYYHLELQEKIEIAEKFSALGGQLIKEDETYLVPKDLIYNQAKTINDIIGKDIFYVPNVTHYINDLEFMSRLSEIGINIVMVNFLITGLRSIYEFKKLFPKITIWGHRIGYTLYEKYIGMKALGILAALAGIDCLHIGTSLKEEEIFEKIELVNEVRKINRQFYPVFSKTTPKILPILKKYFEKDIILLACGYFRPFDNVHIDFNKIQEYIDYLRFIYKNDK